MNMLRWARPVVIALLLVAVMAGCAFAAAQPKSKYDPYLNSVVVVRSTVGEGAGFFVTPDGLLVTNHHVVGGDNIVSIILRDGRKTSGSILAVNEDLDLALVSIREKSPGWLKLARPNEGGVGADVIAIGTAKGLSWSVSKGIVSGLREGADFNIGRGQDVLLIQTDAAINSGNSGGPLILVDSGTVVGVNTISFKKHIAEGISFAVSADNVRTEFAKFLDSKYQKPKGEIQLTREQQSKLKLKAWISDPKASIARLTQKQPAPKPPTASGPPPILLSNAKKFTLANKSAGQLLIITGRAKNNSNSPRSFVRLKGTLHDAKGNVLVTKMVYSGNYLSDNELETLSIQEIDNRLDNKWGIKNTNVDIPSGHSVTFMVVFDRIPPSAAEWLVNVSSVQ